MRNYMKDYNKKTTEKLHTIEDKDKEIEFLKKEVERLKGELYLANREIELMKKYQFSPVPTQEQKIEIIPENITYTVEEKVEEEKEKINEPIYLSAPIKINKLKKKDPSCEKPVETFVEKPAKKPKKITPFTEYLNSISPEKTFEKFYKDMVLDYYTLESVYMNGWTVTITDLFDEYYEAIHKDERPIYNNSDKITKVILHLFNGDEFVEEERKTNNDIKPFDNTEIFKFINNVYGSVNRKILTLIQNHKGQEDDEYGGKVDIYTDECMEGMDVYKKLYKDSGYDLYEFKGWFNMPVFNFEKNKKEIYKEVFEHIAKKTYVEK